MYYETQKKTFMWMVEENRININRIYLVLARNKCNDAVKGFG